MPTIPSGSGELHQKLHSYQMFRAMSKGFMPSNEQVIINLRTLLASNVLALDNTDLSESGRRLVKTTRQWLQQFMDLLQHKNDKDQIQDLIWCLSKSRIEVDVEHLAERAGKLKAGADTAAAYQSLRTVGSLMLTNADFRGFLGDLNVVGREVFKDSAFAISEVAEEAGKTLEPPQEDQMAVKSGKDKSVKPPTQEELGDEIADLSNVVGNGTAEVAKVTKDSVEDKLTGDEGQTLLNRLKQAVTQLRKRKDYSESVSTLSLLIKRYAVIYSRAAQEISEVAEEDTQQNAALDRAMTNAWSLVTSFGDKKEWEKCEELFNKILDHKDNDPQFEEMMKDVGDSLQKLLTDPNFFEHAQDKFQELREKSEKGWDRKQPEPRCNAFMAQLEPTFQSVIHDKDIHNLMKSTMRLFEILSPVGQATNTDLVQDAIGVFVPILISAIQYIPIPRVEVSTPDIDLLLENLIIEPGKTVNHSSFLPYRLKVETYKRPRNPQSQVPHCDQDDESCHHQTRRPERSRRRNGFLAARAPSGLLRFVDEGIASFALDDRGVDIHVDVEVCKERMEQLLTLKAVRVHIHKLQYNMRQSKFSWFGWLLKPLLRPIIRKTLEKQLAAGLADFFHAANRELLYARERLRATRISDPDDVLTFFKAVAARLTPEDDPDVYSRVGVAAPGKGVFKDVYAPGSLVKLWQDEAAQAPERIEEFDAGGWRNEIFDTHVTNMT